MLFPIVQHIEFIGNVARKLKTCHYKKFLFLFRPKTSSLNYFYEFLLLNACKDISLAVFTGKTKHTQVGHHRGTMENEHIRIGTNSCN